MALTTSPAASIVACTMEAIGSPAKMTKQSAARQQVLELIERLGVGTAIPSERQLCVDLGVSRLTVRAALDDLAREGYLIRRRGSGTYVQQPKIAQELTMTSFSEDMRRRGMVPGSRTLSMTSTLAGARLGRFLQVSPSEKILVIKRLRLADGETMAIETLHLPEDRKSTRLNSSHRCISYAVFCLKKKNQAPATKRPSVTTDCIAQSHQQFTFRRVHMTLDSNLVAS